MAKHDKGNLSKTSSSNVKDTSKSQNFQKRKEEFDKAQVSNLPKHVIPSHQNDSIKSRNVLLTIASRNEQKMTAKGFISGKKDNNVLVTNNRVSNGRSYADVVLHNVINCNMYTIDFTSPFTLFVHENPAVDMVIKKQKG